MHNIPQCVLDWCEANGYEKPSLVSGICGSEYWAIAPGRFLPEPLPLGIAGKVGIISPSETIAQNLRYGINHAFAQASTLNPTPDTLPVSPGTSIYDYIVSNLAVCNRKEHQSDRSYIEHNFSFNQKHPGRPMPRSLINVRIQEFCQAHRMTEKSLAKSLENGTIKVKCGRLQLSKGFKRPFARSLPTPVQVSTMRSHS